MSSFRLIRPEKQVSGTVFAVPHSGRAYPAAFLEQSVLSRQAIRSSEDAWVDLLFEDVPQLGAPLLVAEAPRAFVDLNRSCDELDPALIAGLARVGINPRVSSGLGVIPRVVAGGRAIYRGKITGAEAAERLQQVWYPYHGALDQLLAEAVASFGQSLLIDCHSMPHEAVAQVAGAPQIVLGDRFGAATDSDIMDQVEAAFQRTGLRVARNAPFAGVYMVRQYGRPSVGRHAVQVEIDRALYMDEAGLTRHGGFDELKAMMREVAAELVQIGRSDVRLAAQ
ncbi:N-formylglutamate amidohydrolase [Candidatus Halocynthiibacter alkanivorans]|uniref:N-formylglutamate amidohydrolase n=1 Tax=Candidatus Halocynthiibacter alkanivorans TaxID=2267619 RepID=UPI00190F0E35|nr:N-formylglutamate amidohydrolase [Candidatus Halocynthiibacter alkanivorans]